MKMDLRGSLVVGIFVFEFCWFGHGNLVFPVHHKLKGRENSLSAMKSHDVRRRGRYLSAVDLDLGGNGQPSVTGFVSHYILLHFFLPMPKGRSYPELLLYFFPSLCLN